MGRFTFAFVLASLVAVVSCAWLLGLGALSSAGFALTFWLVLLSARLYLLADDVRRVNVAIGAMCTGNENGQLLAALLLVGIYDHLSPGARERIPQRLYLWAASVIAAQVDLPADLTASARQLPPDPPCA